MDHLTAKVSCFARAYHTKNHPVPIFADPAAEQLLGEDYSRIAESMTQGIGFFLPDFHGGAEEGLRLIVDRQLSPSVLGRSAYCERMLENETRLGCRQYVIFASGFDTYSIRCQDPTLAVFELDLPEVLDEKKKRMEKTGLTASAVFVPCDLAKPDWRDKLIASGFQPRQKSFASLLGISYYLEKEAFQSLLKTLGEILCDGSALCFDYPLAEDSLETRTHQALAQGAGEPMKARYTEREMEALLAARGFLVYEHLDHRDMTRQYFSEHNEACPAYRMEAPEGVGYALAVRKAQISL